MRDGRVIAPQLSTDNLVSLPRPRDNCMMRLGRQQIFKFKQLKIKLQAQRRQRTKYESKTCKRLWI